MPPTTIHSKTARTYFDHFRCSPVIGQSSLGWQRDEWEVPHLEGEKEFLPGKMRAAPASMNGFLDVADGGFDEIESTFDGSIHYLSWLPAGLGIGLQAIEAQQRDTGDSRTFDQGGGALLNWSGGGTGGSVFGDQISDGEQAFTATGDGTGVNNGATSATETFVAVIRLVSKAGTGSTTIRLHQSQNDGGADPYAQMTGLTIAVRGLAAAGTDEVTFTGVGVAFISFTGATEAWKRLRIHALSGFTSVTLQASAGIKIPTA
jgi:hypothetical protein